MNDKNPFRITKPVFLIGLTSFFTDTASEAIYPLLPVFLSSVLGASGTFIGLVEGVAETTSSLMKYFFGWMSDRTQRRKPFVVGGYCLANVVRPLVGVALFPWHVLLIRFVDRIGKGMRTAPRDAWLASLAPVDQRATVYGFHRSMDHAGAVLGPLLAMFYLWMYPGNLRGLFLAAFIPGLLAIISIGLAESKEKKDRTPEVDSLGESTLPFSSSFKKYLFVIFLFTLGNSSDAFLLLKLRSAGVDNKFIMLLWSALHVVKSSTSLWGGRLADRIGKRPTILMGWAVYSAVYFLMGLTNQLYAVVGLFLIYGCYFGLTEGVEKALVADFVDPTQRGRAFGLFNFMIGLGALPASLLFGYVWTTYSMSMAFFVGTGFALIASLLLMMLIDESR